MTNTALGSCDRFRLTSLVGFAPAVTGGALTNFPPAAATICGMKILSLLHLVLAQAFYRWAMREISPLHPDVPRIMLRQQELSERARRIWA